MESNTAAQDCELRAYELVRACGGLSSKALLAACAKGDREVAAYLIQHLGADIYCRPPADYFTPLHISVVYGHLDVARMLVKAFGVDVAVTSNRGDTPLHFAAEMGNAETVRVLVTELGAPIEARDVYGMTPLIRAINERAWRGKFNIDVVRTLLSLGADVGARGGDKGRTALHHAVRHRLFEAALMLVSEFGADINAKDDRGRTPPPRRCRKRIPGDCAVTREHGC